MKKDFTRYGNGKVKCSSENLSKMNIFEAAFYGTFHWEFMGNLLYAIADKDLLEEILEYLLSILILITYPISILIISFINIKRAKKEVERKRI